MAPGKLEPTEDPDEARTIDRSAARSANRSDPYMIVSVLLAWALTIAALASHSWLLAALFAAPALAISAWFASGRGDEEELNFWNLAMGAYAIRVIAISGFIVWFALAVAAAGWAFFIVCTAKGVS